MSRRQPIIPCLTGRTTRPAGAAAEAAGPRRGGELSNTDSGKVLRRSISTERIFYQTLNNVWTLIPVPQKDPEAAFVAPVSYRQVWHPLRMSGFFVRPGP